MSTELGFDGMGVSVQERYGLQGIAVWVLLLAAAKRSPVEAQVTFGSEEEFWRLLGLRDAPGFSAAEFLRVTGRFHQTALRRRGHLTDVLFPRWDELQRRRGASRPATEESSTPWRARSDARNASRKAPERECNGAADTDRDEDWDGDHDDDPDPHLSLAPDGAREEAALALREVCGWVESDMTQGNAVKLAQAAEQLARVGATRSEIALRADNFRDRWPKAVLTPLGLANNWAGLTDMALNPYLNPYLQNT